MYNCIDFTDICKELVSKSFSFRCSFYKTCKCQQTQSLQVQFFSYGTSPNTSKRLSGLGNNTYVRINCTEWIIADSAPAFVNELNNVLFPTFGNRTIPNFIYSHISLSFGGSRNVYAISTPFFKTWKFSHPLFYIIFFKLFYSFCQRVLCYMHVCIHSCLNTGMS